jgi:hypothetical protein
VAIIGQRSAVQIGQAGELARLARCCKCEVHIRGIERSQRIQQVVRIETRRDDRRISPPGWSIVASIASDA